MKRVFKRIVAAFVFVAAVVLMVVLSVGKTAQNAQPGPHDLVNVEAFADYNTVSEAIIVPNDVIVTAMPAEIVSEYGVSEFMDKVVAYVDEFLPIRTEATTESETIGKMYPGSVGDVLERGEIWSKIRSGNVEGYIQNSYVCFDSEAEDLAILLGGEESLRVAISIEEEEAQRAEEARIKAEREAAKKAAEEAAKKAAEEAAKKAAEEAAKKAAEEAAKKAAEEAARKAAEEASKAAQEQTEASVETPTEATEQAPSQEQTEEANVSPYYMELSEEDIYLIACIVDWEANAEVYEGKLAVANVVLNRVRSPRFPNTVSGVIYQRSQFGGVLDSAGNYSERWAMRLAVGPRNEECYQAARDAAAGVNNVIDYYAFNGTQYCNLASFKNYIIIGNHCFYQR